MVRQFGCVDNADKPAAGAGDDFFSSERPATAFDELQMRISLIGTIDIQRKITSTVQIQYRQADSL